MVHWRFIAYLAGAFFTAGLAVIPQDIWLAVGFVGASVIFGLVAIILYRSTHERQQKIIGELTKYMQTGANLVRNTPETEEAYDAWVKEYTNWYESMYLWIGRISPVDAIHFNTPRDRISMHYSGYDGPQYQNYANALRARLECLHKLLEKYSFRRD